MLEFAGYFMSGVFNLFIIYPTLSLLALYFIIFACLVLYSLDWYSFNEILLSLFSLFLLLNVSLFFYQASFNLVAFCVFGAFVYPKIKKDHVFNPASISLLITITMSSTIGSASSSLINLFGLPYWLALGVAVCAGVGFALLYLDGVSTWLYKNYNVTNEVGRFEHYKSRGKKQGLEGDLLNQYIAFRFVLHNLKKTNVSSDIFDVLEGKVANFKDNVTYEFKRKIHKIKHKKWGLSRIIRDFAWLLGSCNYIIANPIISMLGGALFVGATLGTISNSLLVLSASSFCAAGSFLAFSASMPYLRKLASRFDYWVQEGSEFTLKKGLTLLLASFIVLASTGNAYYSGFNLLANFQKLLGASSYFSVLLSQAPAWLPVFIGVCTAFITFFIAIALYYTAIDEKTETGLDNIQYKSSTEKLGLAFSFISAVGLGCYFYYRLSDVLIGFFGGGAIVSVVAIIAGLLIAVNFFLSVQGKVQGTCLENAKHAFMSSSSLNTLEKVNVTQHFNDYKNDYKKAYLAENESSSFKINLG